MMAVVAIGIMPRVLTVGGTERGEKGIDARKLTKTMEEKGDEEAVHLLETGKGGGDRGGVCCKFE